MVGHSYTFIHSHVGNSTYIAQVMPWIMHRQYRASLGLLPSEILNINCPLYPISDWRGALVPNILETLPRHEPMRKVEMLSRISSLDISQGKISQNILQRMPSLYMSQGQNILGLLSTKAPKHQLLISWQRKLVPKPVSGFRPICSSCSASSPLGR